MEKKLEAVEMWFLRHMLSILWTDLVTNDVLRRARYQRNLIPTIRKRQLLFLGHIIRHEGLEELPLTVKIDGKKGNPFNVIIRTTDVSLLLTIS